MGVRNRMKNIVKCLTTSALTSLLLGGQLWEGRWTVERWLPDDNAIQAGEDLIRELSDIDGEVFSPHGMFKRDLIGLYSASISSYIIAV